MIEQIAIKNVSELIQSLNELPNNFIYRGQANAEWNLQSSLERIIGKSWSQQQAQKFEEYSLLQFQSKYHLYNRENLQPSSKLAWLAAMQHYGVPTRLLDFSESPYVALYFALEAYDAQSEKDFGIYALDYSGIMSRSIDHIAERDRAFKEDYFSVCNNHDRIFDNIVDRFSYDVAWIAEPKQLNLRLDRQAGSFLISGNKGIKIADALDSNLYADVKMYKFCIASELYAGIFTLLRKMNITSKSIYGDLDGLTRSIRMQLQIYSRA